MLGDETKARRQEEDNRGQKKEEDTLKEYQDAVSAYHQLAIALRDQGLHKASDYFAYRAEKNYRQVLQLQVLTQLNHPQKPSWLGKIPGQKSLLLPLLAAILVVTTIWKIATLLFSENTNIVSVPVFSYIILLIIIVIIFIYLAALKPFIRLAPFFLVTICSPILIVIITFLLIHLFINLLVIYLLLFISFIAIAFWGLLERVESTQSGWMQNLQNFQERIKSFTRDICAAFHACWGGGIISPPDRFPGFFKFLKVQVDYGRYLFSLFLDLLIGYGYRPLLGLFWYLFIIAGFAVAYSAFGSGYIPLFPNAFVLSLISFHGRGFFPGLSTSSNAGFNLLGNPLVVLAALEAAIGLLIEVCFIATFTQRFFGK